MKHTSDESRRICQSKRSLSHGKTTIFHLWTSNKNFPAYIRSDTQKFRKSNHVKITDPLTKSHDLILAHRLIKKDWLQSAKSVLHSFCAHTVLIPELM